MTSSGFKRIVIIRSSFDDQLLKFVTTGFLSENIIVQRVIISVFIFQNNIDSSLVIGPGVVSMFVGNSCSLVDLG